MAGSTLYDWRLDRRGLLRETGQSIVFTHDADDWLAGTITGSEGSRHAGYAAADLKALGLGVICQHRG